MPDTSKPDTSMPDTSMPNTSMTELAFTDATGLAAAVRSRQISSRELLDLYLGRVAEHNGRINAVVTLDPDAAHEAAAAADEALMSGAAIGPLHGLPITIKDALETAGLRSTGGATELAKFVPPADAPAVANLRSAGAVIFGKTNLPRWSGDLQSYNDMFGVTNNPWNTAHTPGGSSGGAAAAVAAGLTSFELGTDIGGSVRIPSHFCGIWGHKPSYGVIPTLGYLDSVGGGTIEADINVFGPLTRSADDLELLLGLLAAPTPQRRHAWRIELPPPRQRRLGDYRIGVWLGDEAGALDAGMATVLDNAVRALEHAGAQVDRNARPDIDFASAARLGMGLIGVATTVASTTEEIDAAAVGAPTSTLGSAMRHHTWLLADTDRARIRAAWAAFFDRYDVLLCPVTPGPAIPHDIEGSWADRTVIYNGIERPYATLIHWTSFIGMAYLPVTTPPLGLTSDGLPTSIQVVGPYLEDRTAIDVARRLADVAGGGYVPPPGF